MTPLTPEMLQALYGLIADYHLAFAVETVGIPATGAAATEIQRLVDAGILDSATALDALASADAMGDAVALSLLRLHVQEAAAKVARGWLPEDVDALSYDALRARIARDPIPMTEAERGASVWARHRTAQHVQGGGQKIAAGLMDSGSRAARDQTLQEFISDRTIRAIEERKTSRQLAEDIARNLGDHARDWDRVARTELQQAHNAGTVHRLYETHGADSLVARVPNPGACPDCLRLFLDPEGKPRIWVLSELLAKGDNVGRKRRDWIATWSTVHPNCHCRTRWVPAGFAFNDEWSLLPAEMVSQSEETADEASLEQPPGDQS